MILYNYSDYLLNTAAISFEEAVEIYSQLIYELKNKSYDTDLADLWEELVKAAVEYGKMRADWLLMTNEEKADRDKTRTALHDSVIVNYNILARYMKQQNMDISWRERVGEDRKRAGDFACYISCFYGLSAR